MKTSAALVLYDVALVDVDAEHEILIFLAEEGLIMARTPHCHLWQAGAIGCLRLRADGDFRFQPYVDPRLRRLVDLDDAKTHRWGWRLDALRFQVKAGVIPGLNGQVQKQDVEPLVLEVPKEFLNLCATHGVAPTEALRGFIADVCALENRVCCPREDGYSSNGSDERLMAWEYWTRSYEMSRPSDAITAPRDSEFVSWTRMRDE